MKADQRSHEIDMMMRQISDYGHTIENDGSYLCLNINQKHLHQATSPDMHAFLSGYLAAVETYEWHRADMEAARDRAEDARYLKESEHGYPAELD